MKNADSIPRDSFRNYVHSRFRREYRTAFDGLLDLDCFLAELRLNGFDDILAELCDEKHSLEKLSNKLDSIKAYFS